MCWLSKCVRMLACVRAQEYDEWRQRKSSSTFSDVDLGEAGRSIAAGQRSRTRHRLEGLACWLVFGVAIGAASIAGILNP